MEWASYGSNRIHSNMHTSAAQSEAVCISGVEYAQAKDAQGQGGENIAAGNLNVQAGASPAVQRSQRRQALRSQWAHSTLTHSWPSSNARTGCSKRTANWTLRGMRTAAHDCALLPVQLVDLSTVLWACE